MTTHSMTRRALLPALFLSLLPVAALSQTMALHSATPPRGDSPRAEELHALAARQAEGTHDLTSWRVRRLAELHIRAAELFSQDDPQGIECLQHAANLLHRHDPGRAARLQELAADRALARGDVQAAAHGYIDVAAFVSRSLASGDLQGSEWSSRVPELAARAELLSGSPLLSEHDRAAIRARIKG